MKRLATIVWLIGKEPFLPLLRTAVFASHVDPAHPYGQWTVVVEKTGGPEYRVSFMAPDAPRDWLVTSETFVIFNGPHPVARGEILPTS